MSKYLAFLLSIIIINNSCYCQEPALINTAGSNNEINIAKSTDITVAEITGPQLMETIRKNNKKLNWVILYTSGCSGTQYAIKYANEMVRKFGDSLGVYFLAGDNLKNIGNVKKVLFKYQTLLPKYIISDSYGTYGDERKKCVKLRDDICRKCKKDIIGVPYHIVFDKTAEVVFHGFKSYKNTLPEDFITYLMQVTN